MKLYKARWHDSNFNTIKKYLSIIMLSITLLIVANPTSADPPNLYFPPDKGKWVTITPQEAGCNSQKLKTAIEYAKKQKSSSVLILYKGCILTEHYWNVTPQLWERTHYKNLITGMTSDGRMIEDVALVQKSVVSFLAGIAREQGKLDINRTVTSYLGSGWSKASPEKENKITVKHLMSMSSGLTKSLEYQNPAGSVWKYNTRAYSKMIPIVEAAAGMDIHRITSEWLTKPIGMNESRWVTRHWLQDHHDANRIGFATSARDLARFGLLVYANGIWNGKAVEKDPGFLNEALKPSQNMNPNYGFLWWLNNRNMYPHSPKDTVMALGSHSRILAIIPSQKLVVVRIGNKAKGNFGKEFLKLLHAAMAD